MMDLDTPETFARLAQFTLRAGDAEIPQSARDTAALLLLDTLGICAAAAPMQAGTIARRAASGLFGAGDGAHAARMLFDGRRVSLAGAVFAAASQTDNLDGHDGYNPTKGHIGVVAVPTLAALAETRPGLTGPEALNAMVVGYEVAGRAAIALHDTVSDYHTSGAWNGLGVAAMAARIWDMPATALREALGIAEYHGPRSQMMREIANPTMLHDGSGWGAQAGMTAAVLAREGFTGAPAITVEAPEVARHWDDLGRFWQVEHQYIKPYPVCRWAHAAIDAVHEICLEHAVAPDRIEAVRVRSFHNAVKLFPGMPATTSQAQYSLPFAVAVMLRHGRIGLEHISGPGLSDPEIAALVDRTRMIEDPRHEARFPESRWADVEIALTDGRVLASGDTHARGGPERPYSVGDITAKFMEFAAPVLGETRAAAIRDACLGLTGPQSGFDDLAGLLYDPPQA